MDHPNDQAPGAPVRRAFAAAARHVGADPAAGIDHVRATMGESKISATPGPTTGTG
ncbi:hypothetical protein [Streptomyces sp. bgisy027]|uniref:hypothetical protein n=1 Tax=Streptomyces sp. bgisy027 TaxID=3413770 RepID=UPI003D74A46E